MKKIIPIIIMMICAFTSCSDDDEPIESVTDQQANKIAEVLNGTFIGSEYISTTNTTHTYEITFTPYSSPQEMEFTIPGEYVNLERNVTVYGECKELEYYDDHLLQTDTDWRYIVNIAYEGAQPELWFYPISVYGRYETHDITIISNTSFILDDITYYKE